MRGKRGVSVLWANAPRASHRLWTAIAVQGRGIHPVEVMITATELQCCPSCRPARLHGVVATALLSLHPIFPSWIPVPTRHISPCRLLTPCRTWGAHCLPPSQNPFYSKPRCSGPPSPDLSPHKAPLSPPPQPGWIWPTHLKFLSLHTKPFSAKFSLGEIYFLVSSRFSY